ncbi:MAG: YhdT family protein [Firmicutes bacterium]|mgnify:CR=1 FL=1|nr:YhdT family protein [Bacillota bacterium]
MRKNQDYDYDIRNIEVDKRFVIAKKEMLITFIVQLCYTFLMLIVAYATGKGDPKNYSFIMGMPAWWFYALLITALFLILIYYIITKVFVPVSVEPWIEQEQERGE